MAKDQSSHLKSKKLRFSLAFAVLLGLAGAGGYAMMNAVSKSFHKVSSLVDYNRWVKTASNSSRHESPVRTQWRPESSSQAFKSAPVHRRAKLSHHGRSKKSHHIAHQNRVRDPFYKDHHPISKKHAVKHRKWSKKLAKLKNTSQQKYHTAAFKAKHRRAASR